ncbi:DNA-directed RNA polymerase subunit beta [candidate division KSB1 bacterium]
MSQNKNNSERISFSKIPEIIEIPDLLNIQLKSFRDFLQHDVPKDERKRAGLQAVFTSIFPIVDSRENYILEFLEYHVDPPKYSVVECQERGVTYAVPLKAKLRLSSKDEDDEVGGYMQAIEQDVYLGNLPFMTGKGTFIINGAERVIVSQLHRSPGVFFEENTHPNGTKIYTGRIIPLRGSWVEFITDINDVMYVYIDRRKKFPVTTLLRALGFSSDIEILELFGLIDTFNPRKEAVDIAGLKIDDYKEHFGKRILAIYSEKDSEYFTNKEFTKELATSLKRSKKTGILFEHKVKKHFGRRLLSDVVNKNSGEIFIEKDVEFAEEHIGDMIKAETDEALLVRQTSHYSDVISNTIRKDSANDEKEALETIYRHMRSGEAPDLDTARNLIERLFFNPKKYDLGVVGRHRMNKKLELKVSDDVTVLMIEDIIAIIKYLLDLKSGKKATDDIDHLGNRRIRTVGEQLGTQFSVGLARMARTIKERMNLRDKENLTPQDLVNARTISSLINTFFGTSQLSQFMDQTNPLAELTHKRRLSALGPGGLTRERAGFEVRDVHYTHYGRLCPIETPEGPNIGLISSICIYSRIDDFGFLETPYRVVNKKRATREVQYLTADDEDRYTIAQANAPLTSKGDFVRDIVKCRFKGDFPVVPPENVDYMDVSPSQIVSAAAALIPFLEHDDANRALMGSNMQRQAVPLIRPETPLIGTGMEGIVAHDSRTLITAKHPGVVVKVTANEIVVKRDPIDNGKHSDQYLSFEDSEYNTYELIKFFRTNQNTCVNQKPIAEIGQHVDYGDVLADGCATDRGELALGRNVIVAFIPWRGYNFEDAIVISEKTVREDLFTSIHIEEFELQVRDTKRGEEELTREIPNVSEEATKNLDEQGIIRIGAEVFPGDIIVGKITPKGETDPTPEEKLLKAIFGDKAGDVKDASLKAPPGMHGIVKDTKLFSRKNKEPKEKKEDKKNIEHLEQQKKKDNEEITEVFEGKLRDLLKDEVANTMVKLSDGKPLVKSGAKLTKAVLDKLTFDDIDTEQPWTENKETNLALEKFVENFDQKIKLIEEEFKKSKYKIVVGDELPPGIVQLAKVYIAKKRKLSVGDKMAGRHGNKGVVAKIVSMEDMPHLADGTPIDIVLNPLGVPSRMNLGQIYESMLGMAAKVLGLKFSTPVFDGATADDVDRYMNDAGLDPACKTTLYDGMTGEPYDQKVMVGCIYMMKLSHLVEDKIHARSIGPYSLITQQPLGGKAQFGGQRFGEMEVWALEAYGAAHTLKEILTVKSDDVSGRSRIYEAIVKGENLPDAGIPESFNVLVRELQGLCLDVKVE